MDDDLEFGASIWSSEPAALSQSPPASLSALNPAPSLQSDDLKGFMPPSPLLPAPSSVRPAKDDFDDLDDFGDLGESALNAAPGDDDFGDFGDFGEAEAFTGGQAFEETPAFEEPAAFAGPAVRTDWEPLDLNPLPSRANLQARVQEQLGPIFSHELSIYTNEDDIRESEGLSQVLVTPESRAVYQKILQAPPQLPPPNWTRSRVRRQHLIALGIPINLDEVLPRSTAKPLPALQISTRPMSAPPAPRSVGVSVASAVSANPSRAGTPRSGTPQPGAWRSSTAQLALGPKPEIDEVKANELLALDPDSLTLAPLSVLEAHVKAFRSQTVQASSLLTYLLQLRDALQQDSETYNKLIGELVGEATKRAAGKGPGRSSTPSRKGTGPI